jgi:hypothetical protein
LAESADHPKLQTPGIGKLAESADPLNLQTTQTCKLGESADLTFDASCLSAAFGMQS